MSTQPLHYELQATRSTRCEHHPALWYLTLLFLQVLQGSLLLYGFWLFPSHEAWSIPSEACKIITIIKHWRLMPMILLKPNAFLYSLLCVTLSKALNAMAIEQCIRCFDKLFINLTPHQPAHFCFSDVSMNKFWTLFFSQVSKTLFWRSNF
jgi:hypothetical protein